MIQVNNRDRNTRLHYATNTGLLSGTEHKPHEFTSRRGIVQRPNSRHRIYRIRKIMRRQKLGKVLVARRQHRRVRIELPPKMNTSSDAEIRFDRIPAPEIAFHTGVDLITLRNS